MKELFVLVIVVVSTITGWILTAAARRRMRRALGREVSGSELTSINTWMKVHEAERSGKVAEETGSGSSQMIEKTRRAAENAADKVEDIIDKVGDGL